MRLLFYVFASVFLWACEGPTPELSGKVEKAEAGLPAPAVVEQFIPAPQDTPARLRTRDTIRALLQKKIAAGQPLVAHVLVPLCDNENQGIVPVNAQLGDGRNLRTNLYWGAGYGIKTHFKRMPEWRLLHDTLYKDGPVLERVVFERKYANGARVILVADAYAGDQMEKCLNDYFSALAAHLHDTLQVGGKPVKLFGGADLVAFNGHNGLMELAPPVYIARDTRPRDAVMIACASKGYCAERLRQAGAYPLVTTTNLMAPEAYVMAGILDAWALQKPDKEVSGAAASAYHGIQKCGLGAANRLFTTGW